MELLRAGAWVRGCHTHCPVVKGNRAIVRGGYGAALITLPVCENLGLVTNLSTIATKIPSLPSTTVLLACQLQA